MNAGAIVAAVPATLTDEHVAAASEVFEALGGRARFPLAFISGSLAVGLGHAHSDIDLHVVVKAGTELPRHRFDVGGHTVDVEETTLAAITEFIALTEHFVATRRDRRQITLTSAQRRMLARTVDRHVLHATPKYAAMLERSSRDVARRVLAASNAHAAARAAEDADGMLRAGMPLGASHMAATALAYGCEVLLAAAGDLYAVDGLLVARLRRCPASAAATERLWDLLHCHPSADATDEKLAGAAAERLLAANGLVAHALVHGWDEPLALAPSLGVVASAGAVRAPAFGLLRFADGFALTGPGTTLRLGNSVAAVWATLDGRGPADVATELLKRGQPDITGAAVRSAVDALRGTGAAGDADDFPFLDIGTEGGER